MKNRKALIGMAILFLAIGFAIISTTLVVNGILALGESDDFEIIFTSAKLDGRKRNDFISSDKKHIEFTSNTLTDVDDETKLTYEVTNTSRNYDANVSVRCTSGENEYIMFNYIPLEMKVLAGETKSGTLTASMLKVTDVERDIPIECELIATPTERESLGDEYIEPFSRSGVLKSTTYDNTSDFWRYKSNITKAVFEDKMIAHETEENLIFDVSAAQDGSVMAYLMPNGETLTTNKDASDKDLTDTTAYTLYIQSDTGVKANQRSSYLFYNFNNLLEIENMKYFDTSTTTNMADMFYNCRNLTSLDLSNFDTRNITTMFRMFANCSSLSTLDLSNFDTSNVTGMSYMFYYCTKLTILDVSRFDTSKVTSMSNMFYNCSNLTTVDVSNFDTSNVTNMISMFYNCSNLTTVDVSNFDTSKVTNMTTMFSNCSNLTTVDISNFDTSKVTNMTSMFSNCSNLTTVDISNFDTSNVTNMSYMFSNCRSLSTLDVSNFDTSKVTDMSGMFNKCSNLITLDLSHFDTSKVTNMFYMFYNCSNLTTLDVSNFDTSKVIDMTSMFAYCGNLITIDVSKFNTSNVTKMNSVKREGVYYNSGMFEGCTSLEELDLSNFDISNITSLTRMFKNCTNLKKLTISNFDTSNITQMVEMFSGCGNLTALDISSFEIGNDVDISGLFMNMPTNVNILVKDKTIQDWILALSSSDRPASWTTDNVIIAV